MPTTAWGEGGYGKGSIPIKISILSRSSRNIPICMAMPLDDISELLTLSEKSLLSRISRIQIQIQLQLKDTDTKVECVPNVWVGTHTSANVSTSWRWLTIISSAFLWLLT